MNRIYGVIENATGQNWDEVIARGEIETVEEFDNYDEAVKAFEDGNYDEDVYGVE